MELSKRTLAILKNFSDQNQHFVSQGGDQIITCNQSRTVYAMAKIEENFPEFALFNLKGFIDAVSLFDKPELDFGDFSCDIKEGRNSFTYRYADPEFLVYPSKTPDLKDFDSTFTIDSVSFNKMIKAMSVISAPHCVIDNGVVKFVDINSKTDTEVSNSYTIEVPELSGLTSKLIISTTNLSKLIIADYVVNVKLIGKGGVALFKNISQNPMVDYIVATQVS